MPREEDRMTEFQQEQNGKDQKKSNLDSLVGNDFASQAEKESKSTNEEIMSDEEDLQEEGAD